MINNPQDMTECGQCFHQCMFSELVTAKENGYPLHVRQILFKKGEVIFKQGTFSSKIIYIIDGLVKLTMEGDCNKSLLVKFFTSDMYLGLNQINVRNESNYTTIALKDTRVCMIEIHYFIKHSLSDDNLKNKLINLLAFENEFLRGRLLVLGTKNNLGRLATTLLTLSEERIAKENIYQYITRKDLADLSNMSIESLERLLSELKKEGVISMKGKQINIVNLEKIKTIARFG